MTGDPSRRSSHSARLYDLLLANDFTGLAALFHSFYASIPCEWYTNNDIARFEGYYASVFYSYFAGLGLDITVEDSTSHGRLDMAVVFNENVYLFELKVVEMAPRRGGDGAVEGPALRGQVPPPGVPDPPGGGGVQPRRPQPRRLRGGAGIAPRTPENRRDLLEITEDRYGIRSTVITSQLPVENWHDIVGDPTLADAILDRLVHSSYQLNLKGESMRKRRQPLTQTDHRDS